MTLGPWNAIWDDGEWVSWDFINEHIEDQERRDLFPKADLDRVRIFEDLVTSAADYRQVDGQVFANLGRAR